MVLHRRESREVEGFVQVVDEEIHRSCALGDELVHRAGTHVAVLRDVRTRIARPAHVASEHRVRAEAIGSPPRGTAPHRAPGRRSHGGSARHTAGLRRGMAAGRRPIEGARNGAPGLQPPVVRRCCLLLTALIRPRVSRACKRPFVVHGTRHRSRARNRTAPGHGTAAHRPRALRHRPRERLERLERHPPPPRPRQPPGRTGRRFGSSPSGAPPAVVARSPAARSRRSVHCAVHRRRHKQPRLRILRSPCTSFHDALPARRPWCPSP